MREVYGANSACNSLRTPDTPGVHNTSKRVSGFGFLVREGFTGRLKARQHEPVEAIEASVNTSYV